MLRLVYNCDLYPDRRNDAKCRHRCNQNLVTLRHQNDCVGHNLNQAAVFQKHKSPIQIRKPRQEQKCEQPSSQECSRDHVGFDLRGARQVKPTNPIDKGIFMFHVGLIAQNILVSTKILCRARTSGVIAVRADVFRGLLCQVAETQE